jgi:putative spermidine/putrescine transport system substrate-binding protein
MKKVRLVRITAIIGIVGALVLGAVGTATAGQKPLAGVNLKVGTWGGPWQSIQKELLVPKMEALGATVTFVSGSPQANMAKLIAARGGEPPMDVMELIDAIVPGMVEGDFLQPVGASKISNVQYLADGQYNELMVANWTTQEGICYNEEKFKELGIPAPKTYNDLAHPKLEGRVQIPDIVSGGGLAAVAGFSFANGGDLKNIKPGLDAIARLKALKFWKRGAEALTQLKSGDIYAAVIHAGWCVRALRAGMPVASTHPIINANIVGVVKQGWMGIMKGSKNADAARAYINLFLDTDFQIVFAKNRGVIPENLKSVVGLVDDPVLSKLMILDPDKISKMLHIDYSEVDISSWYDQWNRAVTK